MFTAAVRGLARSRARREPAQSRGAPSPLRDRALARSRAVSRMDLRPDLSTRPPRRAIIRHALDPRRPDMERRYVTAEILEAKRRKGLSFTQIAGHVGADRVWLTAALHGQHPLS